MRHEDDRSAADAAPKPTGPSPYCSDLESKKILVSEGLPRVREDVLDASCHCWCAQTQQVLGPDRELVSPDTCVQGRTCFHSPFESIL